MAKTKKAKKLKPRGSSNAGRPRQEGDRYPSGKLKPRRDDGNDRVRQNRAAALGDGVLGLHNAENPMDLALCRRWMTQRQHKAGVAFARLRRQARLDGPRMDGGALAEVAASVSEINNHGLQDWTDAETTQVFDAVFNSTGPTDTAEAAHAQWQALCAAMTPHQRAEVHLVCCDESWPQWVVQRCAGHFDTAWERKRVLLLDGLERIATILFPARSSEPTSRELPSPMKEKAAGATREEVTDYVNEAGELQYTAVRRNRGKAA